MADLVPAGSGGIPPNPSILTPLTNAAGGPVLTRISAFTSQPGVKRMLPWFLGVAALGGVALTWAVVAPSPQRTLYAQLDDSERAGVVAALDGANIGYKIDNQSGALSVDESNFYKARMLVASDGALAAPETGDQMLDKLPMGASRNMEGKRLRSARERDLQLSIMEIDGIESVRVHLAEAEKSVFVRENLAPTASVMARLKSGRTLSEGQVSAITNLVAASVPGLAPEAVRVVDQHGSLLSSKVSAEDDRFDLQARMEDKLRAQVAQILRPMLGEGNFSSEIQIELNMDDVTSARESYDKDGAVRSETQEQSQQANAAPAIGVPGVLSNSPPPATQVQNSPPQGTPAPPSTTGQQPSATPTTTGDTSTSRMYELGREVSVSNQRPGSIKRLSVAVVISKEALKGAKARDMADIEALVSAAVGANAQRGDQVKVIQRSFEQITDAPMAFYESAWFATVVRYGASVIAVLLVLLLGVRPLVAALRGDKTGKAKKGSKANLPSWAQVDTRAFTPMMSASQPGENDLDFDLSRSELLARQVEMAQRIVTEKHGSSVQALRQMLNEPAPSPGTQTGAVS